MATEAVTTVRILARDEASAVFKRVRSEVDNLGSTFGLFRTTVAGIAGGVLVGEFKRIVDQLDNLDESAQALGITATELSAFQIAARASGVEAENFGAALNALNKRIADAAGGGKESVAVFRAIGVSVRDDLGRVRNASAVLKDVADRFATYRDGVEKSALANELFGKTGRGMIAFLNEGRDGLTKFGGASAESIENARKLAAEIDKLSASWDRLKLSIGGALAGGINRVIDDSTVNSAGQVAARMEQRVAQLRKTLAGRLNPEMREAIEDDLRVAEQTLAESRQRLQAEADRLEAIFNGGDGRRPAPVLDRIGDDATKAAAALREASTAYADLLRQGRGALGDFLGQRDIDEARAQFEQLARSREEILQRSGVSAAREEARLRELADKAFFEGFTDERGQQLQLTAEQYDNFLKSIYKGLDDVGDKTKEARDLADALGLTFTSAFEDAIAGGKSMRDILRGIEQDLLRLGTRELVTEPFLRFFKAALGGSSGIDDLFGKFFGSILGGSSGAAPPISYNWGGGKAVGGPVSAGTAYLVGERGPELFVPRQGGTIVPGGAPGGGRTMVINNHFALAAPASNETQKQIAVRVARALRVAEARGF